MSFFPVTPPGGICPSSNSGYPYAFDSGNGCDCGANGSGGNGGGFMPLSGTNDPCGGGGGGGGCGGATPQSSSGPDGCGESCAMPRANSGELYLDPDIRLKAMKFDLAISFYFGSAQTNSGPYGLARSASVNGQVVSDTSGGTSSTRVTLTQGDGVQLPFNKVGTSGTITTYTAVANQGVTSTLSYDSSANQFTQYRPDGMRLIYHTQNNNNTHNLIR